MATIATDNDIEISNLSYTNKTVDQTFAELVDVSKTISNKWDPSNTNESDPGLVLLKLMAFNDDKLSYNLDKNINEVFITSCTQETSFNRISEMMGYRMKYYRSATSLISFYYKGGNETLDSILEQGGEVILKAFDTSFKTEDGLVYTLLEDVELTQNSLTSLSKLAMQGELTALTVNGSATTTQEATTIQLYDLDDNNRIYFPDAQIAENGIFINKNYYDANSFNDSSVWRRVDNLNDQDYGQKIYKFGYDSDKELPYLEFPEDMSDLIEDGIQIWYLTTAGSAGKAGNNTLTELNSWLITDWNGTEISGLGSFDSTYYTVTNGTSIGATDKETINEAYSNYKKTVGTFDTLVSCQDYSKAIYRYISDSTNEYLVSNIQATDIRKDPNKSIEMLERHSGSTSAFSNLILTDDIDRNALYLHGTVPMNNTTINSKNRYNTTYNLITEDNILTIDNALKEIKTLCHDFKKVADDDIDMIVEKAVLKVNVSTTNQVTDVEQETILNNIKTALFENFNARCVNFGSAITWEELQDVMLKADSKISRVAFDDPTLTPYVVTGDGEETAFNPDDESKDFQLEIIINNILAGRISLYGIDSSFSYDYSMDLTTLEKTEELAFVKATTEVDLSEEETTLPTNTTIQIIEDSYNVRLTYVVNDYYAFSGEGGTISKNTTYQLQQGEILYLYYTGSDGEPHFDKYTEGAVIKANFDLSKTLNNAVGANTTASRWANSSFTELIDEETAETEGGISLYALGTDETVEILERNITPLNKSNQYCFWYIKPRIENGEIKNEEGSLIFTTEEEYKEGEARTYTYILEEGEMFIYPNENMTSLLILSTGTKLEIDSTSSEDTIKWDKENNTDYIDADELEAAIEESDVGTFENSFKWEIRNLKKYPLTIAESLMYTFIEEEKVTANENISLTDAWQDAPENLTITGELDETTTSSWKSSNITNPKIRVILRVTGSSTEPQEIEENQTIVIGYKNEDNEIETKTLDIADIFQIYPAISSYGDIVLRTPHYEETEEGSLKAEDFDYDRSMIYYKAYSGSTNHGTQGALLDIVEDLSINSRDEYTFTFTTLSEIVDDDYTLTIECNQTDLYISVFDSALQETHLSQGDGEKIVLNFEYLLDEAESGISPDDYDKYQIYISVPKNLVVNPLLSSELEEDTISRIIEGVETVGKNKFDYLGTLNSAKLINSYDLINSFFDYNNVYNELTIEKLDFDNSEFNITGSSKKVY